jgi:hypothetical protein
VENILNLNVLIRHNVCYTKNRKIAYSVDSIIKKESVSVKSKIGICNMVMINKIQGI